MNVLINVGESRFYLNNVTFTLRIMDRLIQMGKDLGYAWEKLQDFVKQQQDYERGERIAERELERDKIAALDKERELEMDRIAAEEAKAGKEWELERDRIAAEDAKIAANVARFEGIAEQDERDRERKRTELETDKESKLSSEIELEKLKHSFEMKHLELMGQLEVQRASFKTELEKQKYEVSACARSEVTVL